jgi:uncharacterized protein YlxP (DUF503 family)
MKDHFLNCIPFKISGAHGLSEVNGIAKFSPAGIVLEFEAKILGLMKTGVKEVRVALAEINDLKFKKGVLKFGAKIEIRLKSFTKVSEIPNQDGKIRLQISREDFIQAEETVNKMIECLNERRDILPPNNVSVSELFEDETKELNG